MSILAECPFCHRKQSLKRKKCTCGVDLDPLKRNQKVRYWIDYQDDKGKKHRTPEGYSLEDAKAADGKVRAKKREGSILEITNETRTTYSELISWYLGLPKVQALSSYVRVEDALGNFKKVFGERFISQVKKEDLEAYQATRKKENKSDATVDMEISIAKTMINNAFMNDRVSGRTLKAFKSIDRLLEAGSNARERTVSIKEYVVLLRAAKPYLRDILIVAYNTGMRRGEILGLRWGNIDERTHFIKFNKDETKEGKRKKIPINANVKKVLDSVHKAADHDYVFTYNDVNPVTVTVLRKSLKAACTATGIPFGMNVDGGLRLHDIRTTVKTNMLTAGVDKVLRDVLLGHSLGGMDKYYIQPDDKQLKAAMNKYTLWLNRQLKNAKVD